MSTSGDWLPRKRADQLAMARTWVDALPGMKPMLGVTDAEIDELSDLVETVEVEEARLAASPGDRVIAARVAEAYKAMVTFMRRLRRRRFFSPPMLDSDWLSLSLRPPDTIRTPHINVTEAVEFELILRNIREIVVNFWIKGETHRAKPHGYDGAVIIWDIYDLRGGDVPPSNPHQLTMHTMASRTPHTLEFAEEQRGETVFIALAWQNERGHTGAWSEIQSAIIP